MLLIFSSLTQRQFFQGIKKLTFIRLIHELEQNFLIQREDTARSLFYYFAVTNFLEFTRREICAIVSLVESQGLIDKSWPHYT